MKKKKLDYSISIADPTQHLEHDLMMAYATGLASCDLDHYSLDYWRRHARVFIKAMRIYNEELIKACKKKKK